MHVIMRRDCAVNKMPNKRNNNNVFFVALICLSYCRKEGVDSIEEIILAVVMEEARDELKPHLT